MGNILEFKPAVKKMDKSAEFSDRMERIRYSLEKINELMADLKAANKREEQK